MFYFLEETLSTNDDAKSTCYHHSDVIVAERQTKGRGQRGNSWLSGEGLNLTFSVVLEPHFLAPREQFLISEAVALSLVEALREFGIESQIKWTNDIYVGDCKIAGVLIENSLSESSVKRSIVGIGLNVNQKEFSASLLNPTSMVLAAGREFVREEVLKMVYERLMANFVLLEALRFEVVREAYRELMYRADEWHNYRLSSGEVIEAKIEGVRDSGELIVSDKSGARREFLFKEIEFIIEQRGDRVDKA